MADDPFRFVNSILSTKQYEMNTLDDEKAFVPYLTNRALSQHIDCILHVAELAQYDLPSKMLYDYYFYAIRRMKRKFGKWPKREKNNDIEMLMHHYSINRRHAEEYYDLLSSTALEEIRHERDIGGTK